MLLSAEHLAELIAMPPRRCTACLAIARRDYCRRCDEFFDACDCDDARTHATHRTYRDVLAGRTTIDAFGIERPT